MQVMIGNIQIAVAECSVLTPTAQLVMRLLCTEVPLGQSSWATTLVNFRGHNARRADFNVQQILQNECCDRLPTASHLS